MICPKCGNTNPDGSEYCDFCGAALTSSSVTRDTIATLSEQEKAVKKKAGRKVAILVAAVVVVVAVAAIVFFMHGGFGGHDTETEPAPEATAAAEPEQSETGAGEADKTMSAQEETAQEKPATQTEVSGVIEDATQKDFLGQWCCPEFETGSEILSNYKVTFHPKGYMYVASADSSNTVFAWSQPYMVESGAIAYTDAISFTSGKFMLTIDESKSNDAYKNSKLVFYNSDATKPNNDFELIGTETQWWSPLTFLLGHFDDVYSSNRRYWYAQDKSGLCLVFGRDDKWNAYDKDNNLIAENGWWVITKQANDSTPFVELYDSNGNWVGSLMYPCSADDLVNQDNKVVVNGELSTNLTIGKDGQLEWNDGIVTIFAPQPPAETSKSGKTGDSVA